MRISSKGYVALVVLAVVVLVAVAQFGPAVLTAIPRDNAEELS
jgi:hypothetical protein